MRNRCNVLSGVKFSVCDLSGRVIACGVTDENGELLFPCLPYGKYLVKQSCAPMGYAPVSEFREVEISPCRPHCTIRAENFVNCGTLRIVATEK